MRCLNPALLLLVLISFFPGVVFAKAPEVVVPVGQIGEALSDSTVVANEGSVVYVQSGATVLYWPGSVIEKKADAALSVDCSDTVVSAPAGTDLIVGPNSSACARAGSVVVALYGSTVIVEEGVDLVRRPVARRNR